MGIYSFNTTNLEEVTKPIVQEAKNNISNLIEEFNYISVPSDFTYYNAINTLKEDIIDIETDIINIETLVDNVIDDLNEASKKNIEIAESLGLAIGDLPEGYTNNENGNYNNMKETSITMSFAGESKEDVEAQVEEFSETMFGYNRGNIEIEKDENGNYVATVKYEMNDFFMYNEVYDNVMQGETFQDCNSNSEKLLRVGELIKSGIQQQAQNGQMEYNDAIGIQIPNDIYSNGSYGEAVDCSSYVCMVLYAYGEGSGNENISNFIANYREEATGNDSLGSGGQITAALFYNLDEEKLNELNSEMYEYTDDSQLKPGDLLVTKDHIEIYVGDGKVYSCGSNESMAALESNKTINSGEGSRIIRIKD